MKRRGVLGLPPDDDCDPSGEQQQQHSHCCEHGVSREHTSGPLGQEVPMVGLPPLLCSLTCSKLAQVLLCRATVDSPEGGMHPGNGPKPQGPGIRAGL